MFPDPLPLPLQLELEERTFQYDHITSANDMKQKMTVKHRKRDASSSQSKFLRSRAARPSSPSATSKADILIAIKPDNMNYIVKQTKNHEFRRYFISNMVERMW
jgi:pyrroline-5-carboxylate reductase